MSGAARILADCREVSECQLDPLSSAADCCNADCDGPVVTKRSSLPPSPMFEAPPVEFAIQKAEEAVREFLLSQQPRLSTVVIPLGKSRNRRKGAAPKRAASQEDEVKPVEKKKQKLVGVAKRKANQSGKKRQGGKQTLRNSKPGMSAQEALREMQRRMENRAVKKSNVSPRKSPAFYRSFPLQFGHNGVPAQSTASVIVSNDVCDSE